MKIKIDSKKCINCGTCVGIAEEVFELGEKTAQVKGGADLAKNKQKIQEAAGACPTQAITIQE